MPTSIIDMELRWTCECKARSWNHHEVCDACGTPKPAPVEEPPSDAAPPELDAALAELRARVCPRLATAIDNYERYLPRPANFVGQKFIWDRALRKSVRIIA